MGLFLMQKDGLPKFKVLINLLPCKRNYCLRSIIFVFMFFFLFFGTAVYSQEKISSIEIIGLKRTRSNVAAYPLEKFLGREAATLDLNEVYAAVKDTGILEPLYAEFIKTEDGLILRVAVNEKWAIFPIPLVIAGSGGSNYGFFLADRNAFGLFDMAVLGGMYGTDGILAVAMYHHTPNRKNQAGWNSMIMYGRHKHEDQDRAERTHRIYGTDRLYLLFGLFYPFTEYFTGSASASFSHITINEKTLNPPLNGAEILSLSPGFSLRFADWDGYLLSQKNISLNYNCHFGISGPSFHELNLKAIYEKSIVPGFRLNLQSGAIWNSGLDPLNENGPEKAHVDILPRRFSARHYAGFSAGFEKYLFIISQGTFSVLGSWQCVFSHGPISGSEIDNGPSGGFRFYLSRLALPAMGANIAYNINSGLVQFSFSIGMDF